MQDSSIETLSAENEVAGVRVIQFPKMAEPKGNLTYIQSNDLIPFALQRIFYIYDVPGGSERGGHAHKEMQQVIIAISGSLDVTVDDGLNRKKYHLNRSYNGLYVSPMVWREMDNFSSNSIVLVLASTLYDPADYYYNYSEYAAVQQKRRGERISE